MFFKKWYSGKISDHFDGEKFFWKIKPFEHKYADIIKWMANLKKPKWPSNVPVKSKSFPYAFEEKLHITNIGHATLLIQGDELNILTDPQFSMRTGPGKWIGPKRVKAPGLEISELPRIHYIFISHNHYDHMDIPSLTEICKKFSPTIITPLGNRVYLENLCKVVSLDWYDSFNLSEDVSLQLLPTQHWSARSLFDRNRSLWGSICLYFSDKTVFYGGDTGFDRTLFETIRKNIIGPLDLAILPIGSYAPRWFMKYSHMNPEEAWEAYKILEAMKLLPIHYDVFPLGEEDYGEPPKRLKLAAAEEKNQILFLDIGERAAI